MLPGPVPLDFRLKGEDQWRHAVGVLVVDTPLALLHQHLHDAQRRPCPDPFMDRITGVGRLARLRPAGVQ